MNQITIFNSPEFGEIRTVTINKEPWFLAKDVSEALGYRMSSDMTRNLSEDDKGTHLMSTPGGMQSMTIINESGLYAAIFGSKLPDAKKFKHWVTSEVLPTIRKHGVYAVDEVLANPDMLINALQALKEERAKNRELEIKNEEMKPKAMFADAVTSSHTSILVGELAKLISQNGINIGQNRLFEWLRKNGYLIKNGASKNMPTQKAMEDKFFEIKESTIVNSDGSVRITRTPKVTGKGQQHFVTGFLDGTYVC